MSDRVNAVSIGFGKDEMGFRCEVLENPVTGARMVAYDVETWWERAEHLTRLEAIGKRDQAEASKDAFNPVE